MKSYKFQSQRPSTGTDYDGYLTPDPTRPPPPNCRNAEPAAIYEVLEVNTSDEGSDNVKPGHPVKPQAAVRLPEPTQAPISRQPMRHYIWWFRICGLVIIVGLIAVTLFNTITILQSNMQLDECASSPCKNGATCVDVTNAYICICPSGWSGQQCTVPDKCSSSSCKNDATSGQQCIVEDLPPCPTNYSRAPDCGHCYLYVAREMTWQAAHDNCMTTPGAYLTDISSRPENDYIEGLLQGVSLWLGGRHVSGELTWMRSGARMVNTYTRWDLGQPDLDSGCVDMGGVSGLWWDSNCNITRPSVCEHDE